jgi:pyruvate,water dikinase
MSLAFNDIIYLLPTEIMDYLTKGKTVSKTTIEDRQRGYALISANNIETQLLTREKLDELKATLIHPEDGHIVKGACASRGSVSGRAMIVKDRSELDKIKEGDILVARLTTPDFISAIKRASAIITDLGGVSSHAAIVARELKKPCITGTRNATKIFKDGDMVKVDADKGIVELIQK